MRRRLLLAAAVAGLGAAAIAPASASAPAGRHAPARITGAGVGEVKLGMTHRALRKKGLVGRLRPGCELGGPNTRSARLLAPLKGSVDFTSQGRPRKARTIFVTGGARARGIGVGATIAQIKAKFPKAVVDRSTEDTFALTLVRIPRSGGGRFHFAVDVETRRTTSIGVPFIPFCE